MMKTGYCILNWNTAQNGTGKAYQPGETFILADDVDLYAIWSANQYTITFDPMGGSPTTPLEKTVNYDSTYGTLPSSNRDGYNFAGWFDEYNNPVNENTVVRIAKNHVIHAGWTPNVYRVYFEPAPGEIIPDVTYKDVTFGLQFGDLPVPALAGFTFNGWLEIEGEIEGHVSSETVVTLARPIYLEADWKGNTYTITCELRFNEGTAGSLEMTLNYGIGCTYSEIWWISDRQGCQDCEIYGLPTQQDVYDYFELDEHWNEYTFNGIWYSDISCTIPINNDTEITNINNHSVYGKLQSP